MAIASRLLRLFLEAFSIKILFKTFFAPWRRIGEKYDRRNPSEWFGAFIVNSLMRFIGMFVRTIILVFGIIFIVASFVLGLALMLIWLVAPLAAVILFAIGIKKLFV